MHCRQSQIRQEHIDEAVLFQDGLPGHGGEQGIHPEGQQEQQKHQQPPFIPLRLEYQAERIGQQKADEGADEGQLHGKAQSPQVLALEHREQIGKGNDVAGWTVEQFEFIFVVVGILSNAYSIYLVILAADQAHRTLDLEGTLQA